MKDTHNTRKNTDWYTAATAYAGLVLLLAGIGAMGYGAITAVMDSVKQQKHARPDARTRDDIGDTIHFDVARRMPQQSR